MVHKDSIVVIKVGSAMDAAQIQSQLRAAGIMCEVLNQQHTSMQLGGEYCIGARLMVPTSQAEDARAIIAEFEKNRAAAPEKDVEAEAQEKAAKSGRECPHCGADADADAVYCDQCSKPLQKPR